MTEVQFDQSKVDYVARPANEAWSQAESIAADERYSTQYKAEETGRLFGEALKTMDSLAEYELELIGKQESGLQTALAVLPAPSAEEAAQLGYALETVRANGATANPAAFREYWQAVNASGDKIKARALFDHGDSILNDIHARMGHPGAALDTAALKAASEKLALPPALADAREKLAVLAETRAAIQGARSLAISRLRNAQIQGNALAVGASRATMNAIRKGGW